jgi:t-SNARE complex subunit (syntaxin)
MSEGKDDVEQVLDEAARGRADHTLLTVHAIVVVVIAVVAIVVVAITLGLYLAL